ncbi:accessory gene regulator B family protein [Metasolibacillus sp. FSL H7-0170]|uniref:accessory gene regulator B family protein n=1 Tax=Metasolibacillus sp. FSL H7-0170 TaxID=2921431 RepID=UPI0031586F10
MIEAKITNILIKQRIYTRLEQEKIRYGVRIILKEFYKLLLLYSVAFLLDCLLPTFIIHMVFYLTLTFNLYGTAKLCNVS